MSITSNEIKDFFCDPMHRLTKELTGHHNNIFPRQPRTQETLEVTNTDIRLGYATPGNVILITESNIFCLIKRMSSTYHKVLQNY